MLKFLSDLWAKGNLKFPRGERDVAICPYCKNPVTYLWRNGFVTEAHNVLVADSVFHAQCFDKLLEEHPP